MQLLCVDCEEPFLQALARAGHRVQVGELGYRAGGPGRRLTTPPHEVEAVIHNLERPACFDIASWGPGGDNDETHCRLVGTPTDEIVSSGDQAYPRSPLIFERQIRQAPEVSPGSFGPDDILRAVKEAGVLVFVLLNDAYMRHVTVSSLCWRAPNVFNASSDFARADAGRVSPHPAMHARLPEFGSGALAFAEPLRYAFRGPLTLPPSAKSAPSAPDAHVLPASYDVLSNAVGDAYSRVVTVGRGLGWYLPEFADNARAVIELLARVRTIRELGESLRASLPSPAHETASLLDDLLPVYRRGYLQRHLQPAIEACVTQRIPLSLLMVDVDHFKQVNDRHGHQAGDEVLKTTALLLKQAAGHKGTVVRYGGEELCVMLPNYGLEEARSLAERLRAAVESYAFHTQEHVPLHVTISIGVGTATSLLPATALIRQADVALQDAKRNGRNQVRVFEHKEAHG